MDNGYLIDRNNTPVSEHKDIWELANNYVTHTTSNVQRDVLEGHIGRMAMAQKRINLETHRQLCLAKQKLNEIQEFLLSAFPDLGGLILFPKKGYRFKQQGAALLAYRCQQFVNYTVLWNRQIGRTCYQRLPVIIGKMQTFVDPLSMKIVGDGSPTNCTNLEKEPYFVDDKGCSLPGPDKQQASKI